MADTLDLENVAIPSQFLCPISRELMKEPVLIQSGKTFDRTSIQEWFAYGQSSCPLTRMDVDPGVLKPDTHMEAEINKWLEEEQLPQLSETRQLSACSSGVSISSSAASPLPALCQEILAAPDPDALEHLLCHLQVIAWRSHSDKAAIANAGVVAELIRIIHKRPSEMCVWHAAEILSLLSLCKGISDIIQRVNREQQEGRKGVWQAVKSSVQRASLWDRVALQKDSESWESTAWAVWVRSLEGTSRKKLTKPKILQNAVRMMCSTRTGSCAVAARLVRSAALNDNCCPVLLSAEVVNPLVNLLTHPSRACRLAACSALTNVLSANDPGLRQTFCAAGGISAMSSLMACDDALVKRWCARLIKALAVDKLDCHTLLDASIVPQMSLLLKEEDEQCQEFGCAAVEALLHCGRGMQVCAGQYLLPTLCDLLQHRNSNVRMLAAKVVLLLAIPENMPHFVQPSMHHAVLEMMQDSLERCMYLGTSLYINLCLHKPTAFLKVSDSGVFRGMLRMLSSQLVDHQLAAATMMQHLSQEPSNLPLLRKVGAVHALVDTLCGPMVAKHVRRAILSTLKQLLSHGPDAVHEILSACEGRLHVPSSISRVLLGGSILD